MKMLFGWSLFVGLVWFVAYVAVQVGSATAPAEIANALIPISRSLETIGWGLATFAKPLLQLAIVLLILLEAGKRLGIISDQTTIAGTYDRILGSTSIQAAIALIIVVAVSIAALAGNQTDVLKDLALVVVGFYFGTRKAGGRDDPGEAIFPNRPEPVTPGRSAESVQQASEDAWRANPGANWRANGPDLGQLDPSKLDSSEEFRARHKEGPSGRRT
jgi:hypothetical protein